MAGPADLRMAIVDQLREWKVVCSETIEDALRVVPRHVFVPDVPLEKAYGFDPVVTHRDAEGIAISSASAPGVVGGMLEQLDIRPGYRVLEVGAGTGYNAALLAHLVGGTGAVTTVEYDAAVTQSAGGADQSGHRRYDGGLRRWCVRLGGQRTLRSNHRDSGGVGHSTGVV